MMEQLRGPFEKFVDWQKCAAIMLLCPPSIFVTVC